MSEVMLCYVVFSLDGLAFPEHEDLSEEELEAKQEGFDHYKKLKEGIYCYVLMTISTLLLSVPLLNHF